MAKERKLVDELGDFTVAVDKAKELAGLPKDERVIAFAVQPPRKFTLPAPATALSWISKAAQTQSLVQFLARARTWAILPWSVEREN
jgi:ClpP class serine protease